MDHALSLCLVSREIDNLQAFGTLLHACQQCVRLLIAELLHQDSVLSLWKPSLPGGGRWHLSDVCIRLPPWWGRASFSLASGVFRVWPGLSLYQSLGSENKFDLRFFFLSFVFQWAAFWTIRIFLHSQPCSWLFGLWGAPLALRLCSWCPWLWRFPSGLCPWRACTALSEDPDSLAVCPLCYPAPDSTPPPGSLTNLWKGAGVGSRLASELV